MRCPNCQHNAQSHDSDRMPGVCPACGIAYSKWQNKQNITPVQAHKLDSTSNLGESVNDEFLSWSQRLYYYACFMPSDRDESAFWGHGLIYCGFICWSLAFILNGLDLVSIQTSFLHRPDLYLHQFGSIAFSAFGEVSTMFPGSVFQVLFPVGLMLGFMVLQRDNFAASIALWWAGQNLIDVSVYLTQGQSEIGLDAWFCFFSGVLVIVLSQVWGGYLLYVEFVGRTGINQEDDALDDGNYFDNK